MLRKYKKFTKSIIALVVPGCLGLAGFGIASASPFATSSDAKLPGAGCAAGAMAGRHASQIMQAVSLINDFPTPTDQDIDAVMAGNLCRCMTSLGCLGLAGFGALGWRPAIAPVALPPPGSFAPELSPRAKLSRVAAIVRRVTRPRVDRSSPAATPWQPRSA